MEAQSATLQKNSGTTKCSSSAYGKDATPTIIDPIYACRGQSVEGLYSADMFRDNDACRLDKEVEFWSGLVDFGVATKTLSKKTVQALELALSNNGTVNVLLLQSACEIQTAISEILNELVGDTKAKLGSHNIQIPEEIEKWSRSTWAYWLDINNECEFGEGETLNEWGLRIEADCGVAAFSIEALNTAPPALKMLAGEFIDIMCRYSHKTHSGWLRQLPCCYTGMEEIEMSLSDSVRKEFIQKVNDPETSPKEAIGFLKKNKMELDGLEWAMDDPEALIEELLPFLEHLSEVECLECKTTSHLPLYKRLKRLKKELEKTREVNCTTLNHPLYSHLVNLCNIAIQKIDRKACLNDVSDILDIDIDVGNTISITTTDETYLDMCHQYQMETGERGVRELRMSKPSKTLAALKNMVVAEVLLLSIDVAEK
jgi:hypothetical protein